MFMNKRKQVSQHIMEEVEFSPTRILIDVAVVIKAFCRALDSSREPLNLLVQILGSIEQ